MGEVVSYTKEGIEALINDAIASSGTASETMGVVVHGGDANVVRPAGYPVVYWIGSAEPINATVNDFRVDPDASPVTVEFATQADIDAAIAALIDASPTTLDTLNELAAALGDDANFAATTAASLGALDARLDAIEADNATQTELDAIVASLSIIGSNNQTGTTYTLALTDAGKVVELNNAAAITLTIPTDATVNFPVNTVIELWQQGAGQVIVAAAGGVTIRSTEGKLKLFGQYVGASLRKRAANEWVLIGDLVA